MRFRSLAAALILAPVAAHAQTAPINPANLPSPLPTRGITDTLGITTTGLIRQTLTLNPATFGANMYATYLEVTLTPTATTTFAYQQLYSSVILNSGAIYNAEINAGHTNLSVTAGGNLPSSETFETSAYTAGIMGGFTNYLGFLHLYATGTVTSVAEGVNVYIASDNTTAGAIPLYIAYNYDGFSGAGTKPVAEYSFRNRSSTAVMNQLGPLSLNFVGSPSPGNLLEIRTTGHAGAQFPVVIKNDLGNAFIINDAGNTTVGGVLNVSGGTTFTGLATATGGLNVGTNTTQAQLQINGPVSNRTIAFSTAGSLRTQLKLNSGAESGSNVGSDFEITTFSDTGTVLANPAMRVTRATGYVQLLQSAGVTGGMTLTPVATSQLPTCALGNRGMVEAVTDATAPTYNTVLAGGGLVSVLAYCDGTSWKTH